MSEPAKPEETARLFRDVPGWTRWLEKNHAKSDGLWLRVAKKDSGERSVSCPEALEVALCYGWIDGQRKSLDEKFFLQKYTPRRARSSWSQVNRVKVQALIESGAMRPAGQAEIDRAKADGRWDAAYAPQSEIKPPDDLIAALKANPKAQKLFAVLDSRNRFALLMRLHQAKKPETRARRLVDFVAMLARGETFYPLSAKAAAAALKD